MWGFAGAARTTADAKVVAGLVQRGFTVVATESGTAASLLACHARLPRNPLPQGDGPFGDYAGARLDAIPGPSGGSADGLVLVAGVSLPNLAEGLRPREMTPYFDKALLILSLDYKPDVRGEMARALEGVRIRTFWAERRGAFVADEIGKIAGRFLSTTQTFWTYEETWFTGDDCALCGSPDWPVRRMGDWTPMGPAFDGAPRRP